MKQKTCSVCGELITEVDETMKYKNRIVHKKCFDNAMKALVKEKKAAIKKPSTSKTKDDTKKTTANVSKLSIPVTEAEYREKRMVISYVEKLTGERATAKTYKLLEDYSKKYGFTFVGMLRGLQYYFEVLEHSPEGDCVGILPYIYDEAQKYMDNLEEAMHVNDSITAKELKQMYPVHKVQITKKKNDVNLIDISGLT